MSCFCTSLPLSFIISPQCLLALFLESEGKPQSPRGKIRVSMGTSPVGNLKFEQNMGEESKKTKFIFGEMVVVAQRPGRGPTLPHGSGRILAVSKGIPHKYGVLFGNKESGNDIEEEYLTKGLSNGRSRSQSNTQQEQPMSNKHQPPQQQIMKRKIRFGGNVPVKKQKVAAKEKRVAKEEENRDNIKLAQCSSTFATETTEKGKRKSAGSPKAKQIASVTTAKWRNTFGKPLLGTKPFRSTRRWTNKDCCGHEGEITMGDWYYGVKGNNDVWQLFLCEKCFDAIIQDIISKGKDVEKDLDYKPICNGNVVSFKRRNEVCPMSLQYFNNMELKDEKK